MTGHGPGTTRTDPSGELDPRFGDLAVRATKAFGFGKGEAFSQTRWRS